jgi:uncharacterized protein YvpB
MLLGAMGRQVSARNVAAKSGEAGEHLSPRGIMRGAHALGLSLFEGKGFSLADLKHFLDQGQPPIALVKYGAILDRQERRLTGGHYVLVVGYDDTTGKVFVHDPYYWGPLRAKGDHHRYDYATWEQAWSRNHEDGNPDYTLLIPQVVRPVVTLAAPIRSETPTPTSKP